MAENWRLVAARDGGRKVYGAAWRKKMDKTFELFWRLEIRGWWLESDEKKELTERRGGPRKVRIVRMNPLGRRGCPVADTGTQNAQKPVGPCEGEEHSQEWLCHENLREGPWEKGRSCEQRWTRANPQA
jgi:hypothetical protein